LPNSSTPNHDSIQLAIPASEYSFEALADIYNNTRVDYIVPMPMNAQRMNDYIRAYDIDLAASAVSRSPSGVISGVCMLGLRDQRSWVTRLGVIPHIRGRKTGTFLLEAMLETSWQRGVKLVQLEVIKGNEPAYALFAKFGFQPTRELLVIRRPPGLPSTCPYPAQATITPLNMYQIKNLLSHPIPHASWVEEPRSILQSGDLKGFHMLLDDGSEGWMVYQYKPFELSHLVFFAPPGPNAEKVAYNLVYHLHRQHHQHDTKLENVAVDSPYWPVLQQMGYFETFRRIEMILPL
jgi:ribosomal protein S18 acetylase RimI-like enzyme